MQVYSGIVAIGKRLGVCRATVYKMIDDRGLPVYRTTVAGKWSLSEGLLVAWELERSKLDRRHRRPYNRSQQQCANDAMAQKPNSTRKLETTGSNQPNEDGQTS